MGRLAFCLPALIMALLGPSAAQSQVPDSLTGTWTHLPGTSEANALSYCGHILVYGREDRRLIVQGGIECCIFLDQDVTGVWSQYSLSTQSWTSLGYSLGRHDHSVTRTSDPTNFIVFGGTQIYGLDSKYNDTWNLHLSETPTWSKVTTLGELPAPRAGHSAVYDSKRDRMVVWGGYDGFLDETNPLPNEVWALSLSDSLRWSRLQVNGVLPSSRYHHAAVYDPVRDEMLIIGGRAFAGSPDTLIGLKFSPQNQWETLQVQGPSPTFDLLDFGTTNRYPRHYAFLDETRRRVLVYDGHTSVWILGLDEPELRWRKVSTNGGPPGYFSADYDPMTGTLYAAGAEDEMWSFTLNEFVPVKFLSLEANWRDAAALIHWAVANQNDETYAVYRQIGDGERQKISDVPLSERTDYVFPDHTAPASGARYWVEAIARDGSITWHGPAVLPPLFESKPSQAFLSPNPLQASSVIHFALSRSGHVTATLYDLAGREIATPINADYPAGPHEISWTAKDDTGRELKAGIYILRLTTPEVISSIKVSKL